MENLTGFIVEVRTAGQRDVPYVCDGHERILKEGKPFTGYFWQMSERQPDGSFGKAHVRETCLVDADRKLFEYGGEAVFALDDVSISVRALRGPESNNRYLPDEFLKYETWSRRTAL